MSGRLDRVFEIAARINDRNFHLKREREALMAANARRRAEGLAATARVAELEAEVARLRAELEAAAEKKTEPAKK